MWDANLHQEHICLIVEVMVFIFKFLVFGFQNQNHKNGVAYPILMPVHETNFQED